MTHQRSLRAALLTLFILNVKSLECSIGFGNGVRVIPDNWINDGYCDCPLDAADETETNACSGSVIGGWAGVAGNSEASPTFQCPQEPLVQLPLSRLGDRICDCCDGVDEPVGFCQDNCDAILAEQRAAEEKKRNDYNIGSAKRKKELEDFQVILKETLAKLDTVDKNLDSIATAISEKEEKINRIKLDYSSKRRDLILNTVASFASLEGSNDSITGLFARLTNDELVKFIVYTCQLNGEMADASHDGTCVPLRMAGVDVGLLWDDENLENCSVNLIRAETDEQKLHVAELVHKNAEGEMVWKPKSASPMKGQRDRRRLDDYPDDEGLNNDEFDSATDDEFIPEEHERVEPVQEKNAEELSGPLKALRDEVTQSYFSHSRVHYLGRVSALVAKIDEIMNVDDAEANDEENSDQESMVKDIGFDPIAYSMTKGILTQRRKYIENGFDFAVSAYILTNKIVVEQDEGTAREELIALAGATLFYADISSEHVWQMISYIVPEFEVFIDDSEHTCASPLAVLCPARTITRDGTMIPPLPIFVAGVAACDNAVEEINDICIPSGDEIPINVPNGLFGYYLVTPRATQDAIEQAMLAFDALEESRSLTDEDEDQLKQLIQQRVDLEKESKELDDRIGGRNESRFGPNGELHSLNNVCHSFEAGKYEYEVCVFGKALQKEKGHGGGTSLGNWQGMDIDHESGEITLKWDKGLRCWNGPDRSATVHLRCGPENKVISADEPDTCRYVLDMTSHIACHERYFERNIA